VKVTVPSLAKINLDLRVLYKRHDGYHELRTVFQTISLQDSIELEFEPARRSDIQLVSSVDIPDNLMARAAKLVFDELKIKGQIRISLKKRIPMGAGLGGGSSNAAAVLIALPALAGRPTVITRLAEMAERLGSDVPFFLRGGTALGIGRGTELYPLPEQPERFVLVVSTGIHVSTLKAYQQLGRPTLEETNRDRATALTSVPEFPILREFQRIAWALSGSNLDQFPLANDFEKPVFETHRELSAVTRKLRRVGASVSLMTGSGSAVFGLFSTAAEMKDAVSKFPAGTAYPVRFVRREQYRRLWLRALGPAAAASCFAPEDTNQQ
jgi:4-diphosphocytidyl-2-C-methyl-D-erythritol kinase